MPPAPAPTQLGWQAAVGDLKIAGSNEICTAVLVRPNLIATVSHCIHPRDLSVTPPATSITFVSSGTPAVQARGVALLAQGAEVTPGKIEDNLAQVDWALIRIAPAITNIPPMTVAPMSVAMARAEVAKGAQFYSAGYGSGAKNKLAAHERCGLLPPDPTQVVEGPFFFATSCIIRLGDSGGPVAIVNGNRPRLIGLIVGFSEHPNTGEPIGIVVSAQAFAPYLDGPLVSQRRPFPGDPVPQNIQ